MPRPHRPTETTHIKQETHAEAKARKRAEAEARNALTPPERRRAFRREQKK